jgi:hypothetical protein
MKKILFFDDFLVNRRSNLVTVFHTPVWYPENIFIDKETAHGAGYASVVPAPDGGWYLYYVAPLDVQGVRLGNTETIVRDFSTVLCLAKSSDGLQWEKAAFSPPRLAGRPQVVYPGTNSPAMGCHVYYDTHEERPERRYKMTDMSGIRHFNDKEPAGIILSSPDGIDWTVDASSTWCNWESDTANDLLWNPYSRSYQITVRRHLTERLVYCVESADLKTWSAPRLLLHPDPLDPPMTQFYGLKQFQYGDMFLGFLWCYQTCDEVDPGKMRGVIRTELVYSYDGRTWLRTRRYFMDTLAPGQYGGGQMYGTAMIERDGELLIYAIAALVEHAYNCEGVPIDAILPGRLRKDGFVGLKPATARAGELTTALLCLRGSELALNIRAPFGGCRVQVTDFECKPLPGYSYDDCEEIRGDHLSYTPQFREHRDLAAAREMLPKHGWGAQRVRIQIRLEQAELFSISGDFGVGGGLPEPPASDSY